MIPKFVITFADETLAADTAKPNLVHHRGTG